MIDQFVTEQIWWHVARASGIVALVLTAASVIWGLLLSTRVMAGTPTPAWLLSMHRFLGALTVAFTGVHIVGLVADSYVSFGWAEVLVPWASSWQPTAVAFGVIGMYLLLAVQISSMMMRRIPRRWWKLIHQSSFLLFWVAVVHGVQAGTDASNPLYIIGTGALVLIVSFLTVTRALTARRIRRNPPPLPTGETERGGATTAGQHVGSPR